MSSLIAFDLDGTLVDSRTDIARAVNVMRSHYGMAHLSVEEVTVSIGDGIKMLCERILAGTGIDLDEAVGIMRGFYRAHMVDDSVLYGGVAEGLRELRRNHWRLSVISNKPRVFCDEILAHFRILHLFELVIGGDSGYALKPDPESLLASMEKVKAAPERSWIVGDHYTDLGAGKNAGIRTCFVSYGFGRLNGLVPDLTVSSFPEFVAHVSASG
ncbi:MAG: HAD hydrolase-like protein [Candidatus Eremiobacteraeota bacterium]|nr:HAD hydrolase-like protein [Candidatus Eremiobacteraeota bacterium]